MITSMLQVVAGLACVLAALAIATSCLVALIVGLLAIGSGLVYRGLTRDVD